MAGEVIDRQVGSDVRYRVIMVGAVVGAVLGRTGFVMIGGVRNMEMQPGNPGSQVRQAKDKNCQVSESHCRIIAQPEAACPCPAIRDRLHIGMVQRFAPLKVCRIATDNRNVSRAG